jgi:hypothetical protein
MSFDSTVLVACAVTWHHQHVPQPFASLCTTWFVVKVLHTFLSVSMRSCTERTFSQLLQPQQNALRITGALLLCAYHADWLHAAHTALSGLMSVFMFVG